MKVVAEILNTETAEVRTYVDESWCDDINAWDVEFQWSQGNYGCDCNRALFFARSAGEPDPDKRPCGEERFRVIKLEINGGDNILDERAV